MAMKAAVLKETFAGIPNPLFAAENTLMLFGDGQQAIPQRCKKSGVHELA